MLLTISVTDLGGAPVNGATVVVSGDEVKDVEGNYMIGFSDVTQLVGFGESMTKRTSTQTSAGGSIVTKVSTATYQRADCTTPNFPRTGNWTVVVSLPGCAPVTVPFTYRVYSTAGTCA
mgnify:CR=1 FL=1